MTAPALETPSPFTPPASAGQLGAAPAGAVDTCTKRDYCRLPAGHSGLCRRHPPGSAEANKRKAKNAKAAARNRTGGAAAIPGPTPGSSSARRPARTPPVANTLGPPVLGGVWARIGQAVEMAAPEPAGQPVGRVMQFQAADAGERLHALLSRTPVYRRAMLMVGGGISEQIAGLIGPPILAAVMATNEQAQVALWPMFASMLQSSAVAMAKAEREQIPQLEQVSEYSEQIGSMMAQLAEVLFAPRDTPEGVPAGSEGSPDPGPAGPGGPATGWGV